MLRRARVLPVVFVLASLATLMAQAPAVEWEAQASPVTGRLRGVSAVSSEVAWASGVNGTVLRTTDGGRRWQVLPVPGAEQLDFRDVDAMSDSVAYALSIGAGETSRIYKTADGGAHWDLQFANKDPGIFLDAMAFSGRCARHRVQRFCRRPVRDPDDGKRRPHVGARAGRPPAAGTAA